jgi:protein-S-isoprenylcysteine O-methyltransferase Ste14
VFVWIILQLAGVIVIAPMEQPLLIPVGLALVLLGISISVVARRTLGNNWANAYEYQMKQGQKLVTTGIYRYIRHPIYLGMIVFFIGAGMVAQSWLWVSSIAWFIPAYVQAKREEELPFGKAYAAYKKRTRMFIPFIW